MDRKVGHLPCAEAAAVSTNTTPTWLRQHQEFQTSDEFRIENETCGPTCPFEKMHYSQTALPDGYPPGMTLKIAV